MKKLLLLVCLLVAGCVSAKYNPETGEISYTRFGDQKMSGVLMEKDGQKVSVIVESQQSEARLFNDALKLIEKGIEIGAAR